MKKKNNNKINSFLFVFLFVMLSVLMLIITLQNRNVFSDVENRNSIKLAIPNITTFINKEYQNNMEKAVADQFPINQTLKYFYYSLKNKINLITFKTNIGKDRYIFLGNDVNYFNEYLLFNSISENFFKQITEDDIKEINNIYESVSANVYFYFIKTDWIINFEKNSSIDVNNYLKTNLKLDSNNISFFEIKSFDDYMEYFYSIDHHLNNKGSYKSYLDIANMLNLNNKINYNNEFCLLNSNFIGSKTRKIGDNINFKEYPCIYEFNFPQFIFYNNKKIIPYYGMELDKIDINTNEKINYNLLYGDSVAETKIVNIENKNNKKLLLYGNSYSNAVVKLLASHYKETYKINGRYYKNFNMINYVNDNKIDDILIIADGFLFFDGVDW